MDNENCSVLLAAIKDIYDECLSAHNHAFRAGLVRGATEKISENRLNYRPVM